MTYQAMVMLLQQNPELFIMPSMTFVINIFGSAKGNFTFDAACNPGKCLGDNYKVIDVGCTFLYLPLFFAQDLYSAIDKEMISQILNQQTGRLVRELFSLQLQPTQIYKEGLYRDRVFYHTLYHEFTHSIDPAALRLDQKGGILFQILPKTMNEIFGNFLILPPDEIQSLSDLFVRSRAEAITVFTEFFVEKDGEYYGDFMVTLPLKQVTQDILQHFRMLAANLTELIVGSVRERLGGSEGMHHFAYEFGYLMSMVVAINWLFKNGKDPLIITKNDLIEKGQESFPISQKYLSGIKYGYTLPKELRQESMDKEVFKARRDPAKLKGLLEEAGIKPVTQKNFAKKYHEGHNFTVYRFDKRIVKLMAKRMSIGEMQLFKDYQQACEDLGIECALGDDVIGKIILESIKTYNKAFKNRSAA
ncbi:MAG: hypothetical protein QF486_01635 [Candidatus Woesearchaeota archaeon]|jgi:hypothetical protein|nr:hypothetical protein [Candidatus Woesearchaeota archaeon]MDP7198294.1 hypothetical protein [Candidatus Woesearchaeota archaeon]MDP7467396.1 hypothetical protein [Candidatus Woesearchaeota archaeon]MDP7647623.1 hypothetical protein [Candidatus Woesearchaeota archaeon]